MSQQIPFTYLSHAIIYFFFLPRLELACVSICVFTIGRYLAWSIMYTKLSRSFSLLAQFSMTCSVTHMQLCQQTLFFLTRFPLSQASVSTRGDHFNGFRQLETWGLECKLFRLLQQRMPKLHHQLAVARPFQALVIISLYWPTRIFTASSSSIATIKTKRRAE